VLRGEVPLFGNKMFNIAVALSILGQMAVIYVPGLQGVFQTEALGWKDLALLVGITSSVFLVDEARKFAVRRKDWYGGYSVAV